MKFSLSRNLTPHEQLERHTFRLKAALGLAAGVAALALGLGVVEASDSSTAESEQVLKHGEVAALLGFTLIPITGYLTAKNDEREDVLNTLFVGEGLLAVHGSNADLTTEQIQDSLSASLNVSVKRPAQAVSWLFDNGLLRESATEGLHTEFSADAIALVEEAFIYGPDAGFEPYAILSSYIKRQS